MKFTVKFQREFEVDIEGDSLVFADQAAKKIQAQFPEGTVKILSVIAEDADLNAPCAECQEHGPIKPEPVGPSGRPNGGGSPGTPTIRVPELVDQIASAA